ncbi:MAG TPA: transglycosylase SLT domain-containing protein [Usitatibacter sp.]|jgi:soluble lytic murein transglycosylase-like protein
MHRLRRVPETVAIILALAVPAGARAGAQQYELLSASVRAALAQSVNDRASVDMKDLETRAWVRAMTPRVMGRYFTDEETARSFLGLVRYESMRAGLDPHVVLAVIDVESQFRKYAVSRAGARGYMQVMPFWTKELGSTEQALFSERINLRYGCTILRYYLVDREHGNLNNALARYNGSLGQADYPNRVIKAWKARWALEADPVFSSRNFKSTRPGLS